MYNPLAFNQMRSPMMNNNPYQMQNQMNPNNQMNQQFDFINQPDIIKTSLNVDNIYKSDLKRYLLFQSYAVFY